MTIYYLNGLAIKWLNIPAVDENDGYAQVYSLFRLLEFSSLEPLNQYTEYRLRKFDEFVYRKTKLNRS